VVRQSRPFFQNDFAGHIANRVMQTVNAVHESVVSSIRAVWYILVRAISALVLMAFADWRLAMPTAARVAGYLLLLRHFEGKDRWIDAR
jgi:ATP-binding cassette subfamily B multidrug efflux pump